MGLIEEANRAALGWYVAVGCCCCLGRLFVRLVLVVRWYWLFKFFIRFKSCKICCKFSSCFPPWLFFMLIIFKIMIDNYE